MSSRLVFNNEAICCQMLVCSASLIPSSVNTLNGPDNIIIVIVITFIVKQMYTQTTCAGSNELNYRRLYSRITVKWPPRYNLVR